MNWKKILLTVVGGGFAASVTQWGNAQFGAHPPAFTAGNVVLPALGVIVPSLLALFTKPPNQP